MICAFGFAPTPFFCPCFVVGHHQPYQLHSLHQRSSSRLLFAAARTPAHLRPASSGTTTNGSAAPGHAPPIALTANRIASAGIMRARWCDP